MQVAHGLYGEQPLEKRVCEFRFNLYTTFSYMHLMSYETHQSPISYTFVRN
jgi:hypothetical protein